MQRDTQGNSAETPIPLWILAPYEEKQLLTDCQEQANDKCAKQFWKMGQCTSQHQLLFSWYCSEQKKELLDCVAFWGSKEQHAKMREDYIQKKRQNLIDEGKL